MNEFETSINTMREIVENAKKAIEAKDKKIIRSSEEALKSELIKMLYALETEHIEILLEDDK